MFDKISALIEIVLNIVRSIASSPALIFLLVGLLTMLLGAILNVGGIIVLGFFLLAIGIIIFLIRLLKQ